MAKGLWRQRRKRHNTARANAFRMEWAVARLRATLLGNVVRRRLVCAWVCVWHSVIGRATAPPSDVSPTSADSVVEEEEVTHDLRPSTAGSRKRTRWQEHFPWPFVTPQALNARGEQIFYHVDNEQDRKWAWRLERAVEHHRAVRERDLDKLSEVHARELSQWQLSVADAGLLRWRQQRIEELEARIVAMHRTFHNGRGYGL